MILVDSPRKYVTKLKSSYWFHVVSTVGSDELHEFAQKLGLSRSWFQSSAEGTASADHYDAHKNRHGRAIALGAALVTTRELAIRNYDRRITRRTHGEAGQPESLAKETR